MAKRRRNPYTNSYVCSRTPHKARYQKAAFAWEVGAKRIKKDGIPLFIYRCPDCKGGWHLTKRESPTVTPILTKASPPKEEEDMAEDKSCSHGYTHWGQCPVCNAGGMACTPTIGVPAKPVIVPQCRICTKACRFLILDTETNDVLPGYCKEHGESMLRPYENATVTVIGDPDDDG